NPDVELCQQRFAPLRLRRLIEGDTLELFAVERTDEKIPFPRRKSIPGVKDNARWTDRRDPEHSRIFHFRPKPRLIRNERAGVISSHRYERPAVIFAGDKNIDFVSAHWTDLGFPQLMRLGIKREPVAIAMAVGINLRLRSDSTHERIVRRYAAVIPDSQY